MGVSTLRRSVSGEKEMFFQESENWPGIGRLMEFFRRHEVIE